MLGYSGYGRRNRGSHAGLWLIGLAVAALLVWAVIDYSKTSTVTLHITGKESVNTSDGHEYRVYAEEDTYVIGDSFVMGRFDSSRFYGRLPVPAGSPGTTGRPVVLTCKVIGWRVPFFSMFKNIKSCDGVVA